MVSRGEVVLTVSPVVSLQVRARGFLSGLALDLAGAQHELNPVMVALFVHLSAGVGV